MRKGSGHLSINENRDDTLKDGEGLGHLDGPENAKAPSNQEQPPQSVAMGYFNAGDILMARRHLDTAESDEKRFLETALRWDPALWIACVLFLVIWLFATVSTIGH